MLPWHGCDLDVQANRGLSIHSSCIKIHTTSCLETQQEVDWMHETIQAHEWTNSRHMSEMTWGRTWERHLGIEASPRKMCCTMNQRLEWIAHGLMQKVAIWRVSNGRGMGRRHMKSKTWIQIVIVKWVWVGVQILIIIIVYVGLVLLTLS